MKEFLLTFLMLLTASCITVDHRQEMRACKDKVDSLERVVNDKEAEIEILVNEMEIRESEISYLGHSLDSLKSGIKSVE